MQLTIKDLISISYYLSIVWSRVLLYFIWKKIQTQTMYIDTKRYKFSYKYEKKLISGVYIWVLVATHNIKKFLTKKEFTTSGYYEVLFLGFN